jgi:hypothetical protein
MGEIYLWKVGDKVVHHTNKKAASQIDGLTRAPDKTITEEQYSAAEGLLRIIDGKIALGKTDQEKADEAAITRIREIDAQFIAIEREMVRPICAHVKKKEDEEDVKKLATLDAEAETLRLERRKLVKSLSVPLA